MLPYEDDLRDTLRCRTAVGQLGVDMSERDNRAVRLTDLARCGG